MTLSTHDRATRTARWSCWGIALLSACKGKTSELATDGDFTDRLAEELARQLSVPSLLAYGLGVAAVIGVLTGLRVALAIVWRVGLDSQRRAAVLVPVVRIATLIAFAVWVTMRWARLSPTLLAVTVPVAVGGLLWMVAGQARALLSGLVLSVSRRIRRGDRVRVDQLVGVVRDVGLVRSVVGLADGSLAYVPNHILTSGTVVVEAERYTEPAVIEVPIGNCSPAIAQRRALAHAALSPYRAGGASPTVDLSEDGTTLVLRVHAFSAEAAVQARQSLAEAIAKDLRARSNGSSAETAASQ